MRIVFRTDASLEIGTGHVMRCLTLANALRAEGAECVFVCRAHPGHLGDKIQTAGHTLRLMPPCSDSVSMFSENEEYASWLGCSWEQDAKDTIAALQGDRFDWLVVDHYALDARWESRVANGAHRLMAIDDLANRPHQVDLLLDQNLGRKAEDYKELLPLGSFLLIGPDYALLRPDFAQLREYSLSRRRNARVQQILVSLGGVDQRNVTGMVLDALARVELPTEIRIVVVMGPSAPHLDHVRQKAAAMPVPCEVRLDVADMARLMADSDLAIGAAGSSSWERCAVGLPSLLLVLAENQRDVACALRDACAAVVVDLSCIATDIKYLACKFFDRTLRSQISSRAASLVDGKGIYRVLDAMALQT